MQIVTFSEVMKLEEDKMKVLLAVLIASLVAVAGAPNVYADEEPEKGKTADTAGIKAAPADTTDFTNTESGGTVKASGKVAFTPAIYHPLNVA
jgi:hypothetical protein